ncbi:MAG: type II toxin-antitoxin system YafQ family toxin [Anaerolineae bacterium]
MKIRRTRRFKKDYRKLSPDLQRRVDGKLRLLLQDPRHPSLRVHKIRGTDDVWELSVTMNCRLIFEIETEYYVLLAVGPHDIVERF